MHRVHASACKHCYKLERAPDFLSAVISYHKRVLTQEIEVRLIHFA